MIQDLRPKQLLDENATHLEEKRLTGESLHEGSFLKIHSDKVITSDGCKSVREYAVHPGAVAILPFINENTLLFERQWRYPINRSFLEFPAGKIDYGEVPIAAAKRELLEETGYKADEWAFLGEFHPVTSYSTEVIFLYMARSMTKINLQKTDDGECIDLLTLSCDKFFNFIENNKITDAKTISMGFWLLRYINGKFFPTWRRY
ncbi:MAG: hypothetical protein CBD16_00630 [Betaproteobacteria bacterium TMED156]|mgnify:CR=1 FL=1|nr:MAG: hypothetical protein CBD16_00630 [Betaproteobacteria bacterium TMED156]|tara:strand:- start:1624 stop:2235 length:612 start_codon:yes stop_codon:yes gene_type:complete